MCGYVCEYTKDFIIRHRETVYFTSQMSVSSGIEVRTFSGGCQECEQKFGFLETNLSNCQFSSLKGPLKDILAIGLQVPTAS
jgi:hypothetical protein